MELQNFSLIIIIIFAFFVFLFMMSIKIVKGLANKSNPKMPPGPRKLPFIGNLHQLVCSLPHHRLRDLSKKYGPLMHLQIGELSTIVVSSPELAKEVMKTHDLNFAQRPFLLSAKYVSYNYTDIALAPYGNYWRQLRKICTVELLSAKRVQSFRSIREEEVLNLVKSIYSNEGGSIINLSENIFVLTYGITARVAFGRKCKYQGEFISFVTEMVKIAGGFGVIADLYPSIKVLQFISGAKLEKLHQVSDQILEHILDEHKERKKTKIGLGEEVQQEDLVDVFLRLQQDGDHEFSLTDSNIKAVIWDIFSAGSETSSATVGWIMAELLKNPRVMKKAQAEVRQVFDGRENFVVDETLLHELKFLKSVIKETLRLHPPGPLLLPRESRERCEINGYEIPAKTRVLVNAWAMGRDSQYWTEAETPLEDLDMTEVFGVSVRKKENMFIVPNPYRPSSVE
ncbi:hypothetical protein EZV62_019915 [Acer yangbiense]|uniref:Uncharacterized protein n=1 Tax=Acer yangbiense TaxID=1000413 RepID=A0A5C7HCU5_9ROSI|nr:hypothetical protein EZV62_019915 [Acer yangbiense]